MKTLTVRSYMVGNSITIGANQPLALAHKLMRAGKIRHLPVLSDGKLVGIVSDRDLHFIETLKDVDPDEVTVAEAMTPDPFTIGPETSLEWVAMEMARHKYGSTLVVDGERVMGVFTTVDALRALQDLLSEMRRQATRLKKRRSRRPALEEAL